MKKLLVPALLAAVPFGFLMGAAYSLESPVSTSILVGILGGVACAVAVAGFVAWRDQRFTQWVAKAIAPYEAEGIEHQGYAAFGSNATAVGLAALGLIGAFGERAGWLVLTKQRLVFLPHKHSLLGKPIELATADIAAARPGHSLRPNTILVGTRSKQSLQLRVRGRNEWLAKLPSIKAA
jgi:hypothetical protein